MLHAAMQLIILILLLISCSAGIAARHGSKVTYLCCLVVRGMMYYKRALVLQSQQEGATVSGDFSAVERC